MYAWLAPRVVLPAYERLGGRRFWTEYRRLGVLQWQTPEELEARAIRKLRVLVAHAVAHVPHYRELFRRAGVHPGDLRTLADLDHVPITTKAELRSRDPHDTVADDLPARRRWRTLTSGSTGSPFEFYTDAGSADGLVAGYLLFLDWAGVSLWHPRVDIGNQGDRPMASILPRSSSIVGLARRMLLGERTLALSGVDVTPGEFVTRTRGLPRGYFVRGYASYLARLAARVLEEDALLPSPPRVVISCGERLTTLDAETIGRAFRCRVVDQYSAWEVLHIAQTCPDSGTVLHVNSERVILRTLRDDGLPATPGQRGRIVITVLGNDVMPFINYEIGDSGIAGERCSCPRGFPTLTGVEGRLGEAIRTPAGRLVSPVTLDGLFRFAAPYVSEYQAVQSAADAVTLLVVPTARFTAEVATTLRADLERIGGAGLVVRVEPVARIPAEPSGKRLVIRSHLGPTG